MRRGGCRETVERALWWLACAYLVSALLAIIVALWKFLRTCMHRHPSSDGPVSEGLVPDFAIREADPLIYSQYWLIKQGLAVTWQNPDIHLELASSPGAAVDTSALLPDTEYFIFARIWNGSPNGPAADVEIDVSYLDFGIGGVSVPVGVDHVDLPVKGAIGSPAFARVVWRTPPVAGHYCLQARIVWPPDANPENNLGQHNVDVKALNSPTARFTVPVRNTSRQAATIRLAPDGYTVPSRQPCPPGRDRVDAQAAGDAGDRARAHHAPHLFPVPPGWEVTVDGLDERRLLVLDAGQTQDVQITLTAPDGFVGRQPININGFDGSQLIGGVTLIAEGVA